jgi:hypothetical protein
MQTLMPGKMVVTRSKGNCPPEDVVALRDAALGLDEKKGYITIGAAGRTSVWRGLNSEDTFKWHDALLSALSGYALLSGIVPLVWLAGSSQCYFELPTVDHSREASKRNNRSTVIE